MLWNGFGLRRAGFYMNIHPDFRDLLQSLEEHEVDYMIVGGYAVAYHGYPRFTNDIDIFSAASRDNVERLRAALLAFAFAFDEEDLPRDAFTTEGNIVTFGAEPAAWISSTASMASAMKRPGPMQCGAPTAISRSPSLGSMTC